MTTPPPRRPASITQEEAKAIVRRIDSELSPEERDLLNDAGKKMRFWTNTGVIFGFMTFALPVHARSGIRLRFLKGIAAGTAGIFLCAPLGMLYGANRAQQTIMTHPNHEHLLKVLKETRSEIMAGRGFGESSGPSESSSSSEMSPESDQSQSWASERQDAFPTTSTSSMDKFDENTLLTDDQVDRQSQGTSSSNYQADLATFTPRNRPSQDSSDQPRSAWDNLRARAAQSKPPQEKPKEKDVWGNDK